MAQSLEYHPILDSFKEHTYLGHTSFHDNYRKLWSTSCNKGTHHSQNMYHTFTLQSYDGGVLVNLFAYPEIKALK